MLVNVSPEKVIFPCRCKSLSHCRHQVPLQTLQYSAVMLPLGVAAAMTGK